MSTASNEGDRIPMSQGERDRLRRPARRAGRPTYPGGGCACCGSLLAMSTDCCSACKQVAMPRSSMACGASLPTTANRRHSAAVCCNSTARTTLTSAPRSQLRNWLSAAWRCPLIPCGAGCSPKACGNASAAVPHRSRRPRRACFGELVQMDTSIHDWTEGRGEDMVLIHMIDDATSRLLARFYDADTVLNHMDLLLRWLQAYGRPLALYTDRHSIFEVQNKGQALPEAETQFGRALRELGIDLSRAHSPQAKGRVERSFGTAQDRLVKEMRLANVRTIVQANDLLDDGGLLAKHNRLFSVAPREASDAHRTVGTAFNVAAILSLQQQAHSGQRLHGAFRESALPAGQADLPGRTRRESGAGTAFGREPGDPFREAVPEVPRDCRAAH